MLISYYQVLLILLSSFCTITGSFAQASKSVPIAFAHLYEVEGMMSDSVTFPSDYKDYIIVDTAWQVLSRRQVKQASKAHHLATFYADSSRAVRVQMMIPPSAKMLPFMLSSKQRRKDREKQRRDRIGAPAPQFEATTLGGDRISLEGSKGKVVILNFWFVDCSPCRKEIPDLNKLVNTYKAQDIVFVAIALDKPDRLKEFLAATPLHYDVVPTGEEIKKIYKITGYPTNMVIDREGRLIYEDSGVGLTSINRLERAIKKSLK